MRSFVTADRRWVLAAAVLVGEGAVPVLGQVAGISITRRLDGATLIGSETCDPPQDWREVHFQGPADFGPWEFSFRGPRSSICQDELWIELNGSQSSQIAPTRIGVQLSTGFTRAELLPEQASAVAVGGTTFSYVFYVHRRTAYALRGESGGVEGTGSLQLVGPRGTVFERGDPASGSFSTAGDLERGEYSLWVTANVDFGFSPGDSPASGGGTISFVLQMQLPSCPCDWNGDGGVNSVDFFDFLADFFAGRADLDLSSSTTPEDFFGFLDCFFDPPVACG